MLLVDSDIRTFLSNGQIDDTTQTSIKNGSEACITNIGYDLRVAHFIKNDKLLEGCELKPGESVLAESTEVISFDNSTSGQVALKNSRIRMGLSMDAPVYQPGHKQTRIYFRLTNISDSIIKLASGEQYAMLMFEQLNKAPDNPYDGAFQDEFDFKGLAGYTSKYADQIESMDGKIKDLKTLEKRVYENVITILSIFVAIFTLINVNVSLASSAGSGSTFLVFNLGTLGAFSFLALLLNELLNQDSKKNRWLWIVPVMCFVSVILVIWCLGF